MSWPASFPVVQVRIARPTNRLADVVRFYRDGVGLRVLGSFENHAGYSGAMVGLPDRTYHLELTTRSDGAARPLPTPDDILVFYLRDRAAVDARVERLLSMGYEPVPPLNPYWEPRGMTFCDPDGWRIVLADAAAIPAE